jgi:putative ABC transport system ATP-binding protein
MIRLEGLGKVFQTADLETHALRGIRLDVLAGEFVAITGPSGCGKSTLLAILGMLDVPTTGSYRMMGRNVACLSSPERARLRGQSIGFIFQSFNLIGELTVRENVELPLRYQKVGGAERRRRAALALDRVGMGHRGLHRPSRLSGGEQQRVAVARALVTGPSLLLADEPTGNLDSRNSEQVMTVLRELHRQGATICMVTHDGQWARRASRTVHLCDGRIVDDGLGAERPAQAALG